MDNQTQNLINSLRMSVAFMRRNHPLDDQITRQLEEAANKIEVLDLEIDDMLSGA